jgi:hypothetical protein
MKNQLPLAIAISIIIWLCVTLVRVENQRYAMQVGMCHNVTIGLPDLECIKKTQTRTDWWWHLFYALKD